MMRKYISVLKLSCAPGSDGITSEHLKYCTDTKIHLCKIFTLCFQYGVVPYSFKDGILVPVLKKPTLAVTIANNYHPVIVSSILSMLLELYIF